MEAVTKKKQDFGQCLSLFWCKYAASNVCWRWSAHIKMFRSILRIFGPTEGKPSKRKMSRKCGKSLKGGVEGISNKKQKVHNSNCRLFWDETGGLDFKVFSKIQMTEIWPWFWFCICVIYWWDKGKIWYKYGWYLIEITSM